MEFNLISSIIIDNLKENIIIENKGNYYFIEDDLNKMTDVFKMPYYIKDDWLNHNKQQLNIKIVNKHIQRIDMDSLPLLESKLKSIRRDLIIKGIV